MGGCSGMWVVTVECEGVWPKTIGNGQVRVNSVGNGWKKLFSDENGWWARKCAVVIRRWALISKTGARGSKMVVSRSKKVKTGSSCRKRLKTSLSWPKMATLVAQVSFTVSHWFLCLSLSLFLFTVLYVSCVNGVLAVWVSENARKASRWKCLLAVAIPL